jgi:hypothetical protein
MVYTMILAMVFLCAFICDRSYAERPKQGTFSSPQEAITAMVTAIKSGNNDRLIAVFGEEGRELFFFDDDTTARFMGEEFLRAYGENNRLESLGKKKVVLHVGKDDWIWPIPVIKVGQRWRFDSKEGRREILARRIGENELAAIQVCLAYVDAQREYAQNQRMSGIMEYAQKLLSDPGKKDGLCWEDKEDGKQGPLGPLVGNACKTTHAGAQQTVMAQPYHGYFYKILKRQGKHAQGGAYDYVVDGRMIGGFALVAYPARYGSSGITTLIVNHDGVLYEKDLGKNTNQIAEAMTTFDPDQTWKRTE